MTEDTKNGRGLKCGHWTTTRLAVASSATPDCIATRITGHHAEVLCLLVVLAIETAFNGHESLCFVIRHIGFAIEFDSVRLLRYIGLRWHECPLNLADHLQSHVALMTV